MPFHFSLQSRPDTFGNTMYDIRSAIIPCVAAHGQRQAVIVHEPGDPPRCGFIDREGIALQCDLVHPPQRTEVPLVEIQGVGRDTYAPAVIPRRPPYHGIVLQVGKHPGNPVHHPDTFQCDLGRHPRPAAISIQGGCPAGHLPFQEQQVFVIGSRSGIEQVGRAHADARLLKQTVFRSGTDAPTKSRTSASAAR